MKIALLFFLFIPTLYAASEKEVTEVKESLRALMHPLLPGKSKSPAQAKTTFSVEKCEKHKINWMDAILMKDTKVLNYSFRPGCDIEGGVTPKILLPFPVDLKLRNLEDYTRLETVNKINASLESKPLMKLEIRSGTLTGSKGKILFEADYNVRIEPMKGSNPIDENLGGELRITEIFGKKVLIKEKIFVE
jgi:hypothetical protein